MKSSALWSAPCAMRGLVALGCIAATASLGASAATTTGSLSVQITIQADCKIASLPALNFGTQGALTAAVDATTTLQVQCTDTTPYSIVMDAGQNSSDVAARKLLSGSATITYSLYQGSCCSTVWGDTVPTGVSAVGNGSAQSYTVYGRVPAQATPAPGTYNDTVGVTVSF